MAILQKSLGIPLTNNAHYKNNCENTATQMNAANLIPRLPDAISPLLVFPHSVLGRESAHIDTNGCRGIHKQQRPANVNSLHCRHVHYGSSGPATHCGHLGCISNVEAFFF